MKLFYKAGACSLAAHIVMAELNMAYELEAVDLQNKTCISGDFYKINAKGSVPALLMDSGEVLTECAVISQYLADQNIESTLLPKLGTIDRYRCLEWMNYIATDIHKNFGPFFSLDRMMKNTEGKNEFKTSAMELLKNKIAYASEKLAGNDYLLGKDYTIADAYLFTCLGWGKYIGLDIGQWPNLAAHLERVSQRPAVLRALKEEGLL
ncbi:MAG: glutathione transferase GstA [Bacteriovoracaceae bacterium]|nr:glutathione transferase GstA [Bacteriovoracaceae bacterium]